VSALTVIGAYRCGQTPRFSFVFMNACQVGIPGEVLGEVGGFPGELVRGGAYGVIAPLWDVHDDVAQDCAMAFYKAVFKEGKSVAEALRETRATYKSDSSTTPVAYVFYGHPSLKLRKAASNG
jgi:CHAT domain-containing protein